ncbi:hypothetical protein B0H13DRAFT_2676689 [Mycena leptocephala]|nr:hypothetical protein B0H13DRAFT_2676689 [Mycena leptocephala]
MANGRVTLLLWSPSPVRTAGLPFTNTINLPPVPADPPTPLDIIRAKQYAQQALIAELQTNSIDDETLASSLVYADSILSAASQGAAPPWFADAMKTALDRHTEDMKKLLDEQKDDIVDQLKALERKIDKVSISTAKAYNRTLLDGKATPFVPVPFPNGVEPSANDNKTNTPLMTTDAIDGLSCNELKEYSLGYYPDRNYGPGQNLAQRRESVRHAIGCTVRVV